MMSDKWPNDDRRVNPHTCNSDTCQYHYLTESVIADLKESVIKLLEGQTKMGESIVQLTEAFKMVERIDARLAKLEDLAREKDKEQDVKIDELKGFMYKAMGAIAAAGVAIEAFLRYTGIGG